MRSRSLSLLISFLCALLLSSASWAEDPRFYKPYVLARITSDTLSAAVESTKTALSRGGFTVVGEYSPYEGAHVVVVTSDALKAVAAQSEFGGYGSALRVGITQVEDKIQIAYTNPSYMAHVYRMKGDLADIAEAMKAALGAEREFGSEHGNTEFVLRKYHYMMFMPYFDDQLELAEYSDHQTALQAVENGLASGRGGTRKVYRIDLPGKEESLFGVAINEGEGADKTVMTTTDIAPLKHTPHLPYELLVSGGNVYALHGKFRIAQSFPDLGMGTFMKISGAPDGIEEALKAVARSE
ncbi:MAG: hypothetical protein Kow006_22970 [Gammaproteobacteria bacterium]